MECERLLISFLFFAPNPRVPPPDARLRSLSLPPSPSSTPAPNLSLFFFAVRACTCNGRSGNGAARGRVQARRRRCKRWWSGWCHTLGGGGAARGRVQARGRRRRCTSRVLDSTHNTRLARTTTPARIFAGTGSQFACFTGTKAQILTQLEHKQVPSARQREGRGQAMPNLRLATHQSHPSPLAFAPPSPGVHTR
jgi:hypothetical protein